MQLRFFNNLFASGIGLRRNGRLSGRRAPCTHGTDGPFRVLHADLGRLMELDAAAADYKLHGFC
ncbi:hypothetical protein D3C75_1216130 [compost metagenome]